MTTTSVQTSSVTRRVDELDWNRIRVALDEVGIAAIGTILNSDECHHLSAL
jgi:hypothetical protein